MSKIVELPAETADSESREQADFIDERELLRRVPVSRRTIFEWRGSGKIPFVHLGGRRVLFHWPSVCEALLRQQRNSPANFQRALPAAGRP